MTVPAGFFSWNVDPDTPVTASLKVAVRFAVRLTPVAAAAGVRALIVGRGPVTNVHVVFARGVLAASRIPVARVTVYLVSFARLALGFRIHWFVVPFRDTTAPTAAPVVVFFSVKVLPDTPVTALLKVAVTLLATGTAVALTAGVLADTVGPAVAAATVRGTGVLPAPTLPAASIALTV
jgi:hypothetical protein